MALSGIILLIFRLVIVVGSGYVYVRARGAGRGALATVALSHLVGMTALAAGVTVGLIVTGRVSTAWAVAGLVAIAGLGLVRGGPDAERTVRRESDAGRTRPNSPLSGWEWLLAGMVALGIATASFRLAVLPPDWDGWAIWQLKARAIVSGDLKRVLTLATYAYDHPDYPLLVPAGTWWLCGSRFEPKIGQLNGFLFFLDLLILFYSEVGRRLPRLVALAGLAVMVSWPPLVKHSTSGFADVPMAAYAFVTLTALLQGNQWLTGALLMGALLTKNEGLFTLAGALLVALAWDGSNARRVGEGITRRWTTALLVLGTGVVTAGAWAIMKSRWGLRADLLDPARWPGDLARQLPVRAGIVARGFVREALSAGPRYPGWGVFWPLAGGGLVASVAGRVRETIPLWLFAAAHFGGVAVAYLITPLDPAGHLEASVDRLWLQIAPVALLALLVVFGGKGQPDS